MSTTQLLLDSPIGTCLLEGRGDKVVRIQFGEGLKATFPSSKILTIVAQALEEYFAGKREHFESEWFLFQGTNFQQQVWQALWNIAYGKTRSYKEIGILIENKKAVRAIGRCVGSNPLPIVVPCHRVIGSDGTLTGFAYGLETKRWLLELEQSKHYGKQQSLFL
ncbi:MAG: methylated-DNA--[protein]-cysteine S-methyltransferase [Aureispira sp.]